MANTALINYHSIMEKISGVVILFNPELKTIEYILSYLPHIDKLYVTDNSSNRSAISAEITKLDKTVYLHDGENLGIAKRLNQACKLAIEDGFEWLLTLDQDSSFAPEDISAYVTCIKDLPKKQQIAVTGVTFIEKTGSSINCNYKEVTGLITSGSIIHLNLFDQVGGFDEALFIDQVDFEYCFRAILKGFRIIQFENIFLNHSLGELSVHRSLKSFKNTKRSLHSPVRIYYMTRNYFYIRKIYKKDFKAEISAIKKDLLNRIKNNLLYNKKRKLILKFFILGLIDFKRNRMGKISH